MVHLRIAEAGIWAMAPLFEWERVEPSSIPAAFMTAGIVRGAFIIVW
jgi:hypothetical protein